MRVAIVGEPTGWHVGRLVAAIQARGHEATVVRWHELTAVVAGTAASAEQFLPLAIDQADIVVVRGMPQGGLEDVIFRMDVLGRLAASGQRIINSPRSLELAIDKYLSLAKLAAGGVSVPHTIVAQNPATIQQAWQSLGCDAVVKPLFGSCGRGIQRLSTRESLEPLSRRPPRAAAWLTFRNSCRMRAGTYGSYSSENGCFPCVACRPETGAPTWP